jgi:hypothetical protein
MVEKLVNKKPEKKERKPKNQKLQKAVLNLLKERQKWLISSGFVKAIPKIKSRGQARNILRELEKTGKVQIAQNPERKTGYIFGLPQWYKPTNTTDAE